MDHDEKVLGGGMDRGYVVLGCWDLLGRSWREAL